MRKGFDGEEWNEMWGKMAKIVSLTDFSKSKARISG